MIISHELLKTKPYFGIDGIEKQLIASVPALEVWAKYDPESIAIQSPKT